jgi:hypothetical protein
MSHTFLKDGNRFYCSKCTIYRDEIQPDASGNLPRCAGAAAEAPSSGKCTFKILFFTNIHIEYIFYIISDFFCHFYRVETIFFDDFIY